MKILAISDEEVGIIYNPQIVQRFHDVDLVISCGDLPYYYLEFVISMLDRRLYYVHGNHTNPVEQTTGGERSEPWGAINIHSRVLRDESGLLLAGIEGCHRYNYGPHQYSQTEMWGFVFLLIPRLFINRLRYGHYLDILVTHAPPWKIHDDDDQPHQGIKAFNWLVRVFKPAYHLHGHVHAYRHDSVIKTQVDKTQVINAFEYQEIDINIEKTGHR